MLIIRRYSNIYTAYYRKYSKTYNISKGIVYTIKCIFKAKKFLTLTLIMQKQLEFIYKYNNCSDTKSLVNLIAN